MTCSCVLYLRLYQLLSQKEGRIGRDVLVLHRFERCCADEGDDDGEGDDADRVVEDCKDLGVGGLGSDVAKSLERARLV